VKNIKTIKGTSIASASVSESEKNHSFDKK